MATSPLEHEELRHIERTLDAGDTAARLQAIAVLSDRLGTDVRNRLAALGERLEDGTYAEADDQVRKAAADAVRRIDSRRAIYSAVETLFFGLSLGSVLVLVAIGLAITFGVMGVINMAHGELMMLGAYTTYVVQLILPGHVGASVLIAIPAAFVVAGAVAAGAKITMPVDDMFWGDRYGKIEDPFGHHWSVATHVRDVSLEEMRAAMSKMGA